ncbi:MAG: hypothetical protein GXP25_16630 [Planctomycetes bacterium]|nr:hypothetical protein [Planctomycetota bacterium]
MSSEERPGLILSFAHLLRAITGLIWVFVIVILLAGVGWGVIGRSRHAGGREHAVRTKSIPKPIDWAQVDAEIVASMKKAHAEAEVYASRALDVWEARLMRRVDNEFLGWFFGYFNQQILGLKGLGYQALHWWDGDRPTAAERLTEEFQEEFAKRVLRPQIAQIEMERIAQRSVEVYADRLRSSLAVLPAKYNIPKPDWERHLHDMAVIAEGVEGNREVALTMKALTVSTVATAVVLGKVLQGSLRRVATRVSRKVSGRMVSKAAGRLAAKTGGKVGAELGGKFLGPIIGAGIILWDIYDHHRTKKIEQPILRQNIADYLDETKHMLLTDPETGILSPIHQIEETVIESTRQVASAEGAQAG